MLPQTPVAPQFLTTLIREHHMNIFVIVAIVAIILLVVGGFVQALQFLLWVGAVLLIIAVIAWAVRSLSGRNR